jgi:hypothetical protein
MYERCFFFLVFFFFRGNTYIVVVFFRKYGPSDYNFLLPQHERFASRKKFLLAVWNTSLIINNNSLLMIIYPICLSVAWSSPTFIFGVFEKKWFSKTQAVYSRLKSKGLAKMVFQNIGCLCTQHRTLPFDLLSWYLWFDLSSNLFLLGLFTSD